MNAAATTCFCFHPTQGTLQPDPWPLLLTVRVWGRPGPGRGALSERGCEWLASLSPVTHSVKTRTEPGPSEAHGRAWGQDGVGGVLGAQTPERWEISEAQGLHRQNPRGLGRQTRSFRTLHLYSGSLVPCQPGKLRSHPGPKDHTWSRRSRRSIIYCQIPAEVNSAPLSPLGSPGALLACSRGRG